MVKDGPAIARAYHQSFQRMSRETFTVVIFVIINEFMNGFAGKLR